MKYTYLFGSFVGSLIMTASAVDYTWTGTALDGDWNNAANWDGNGIPVDDYVAAGALGTGNFNGISTDDADRIIFTGAALPSLNVPGIGGDFESGNTGALSTPTMQFNSGGSITFNMDGREAGVWTNDAGQTREIWIVGDGVSGGTEDVTLNITGNFQANRHGNNVHTYRINSDGLLNIAAVGGRWAWSNSRSVEMTIDGGTVVVSDSLSNNFTLSNNFVDFVSIGGSFTANYGDNLPDYTSVLGVVGSSFVNNSGGVLDVVDNGTSYTITAIIPPDPNYWTGTGGATWDQATTANFTTNDEDQPLVTDTFANATATSGKATFADAYFDGGASQAVTVSNITIPAGGITGDLIDFTNTSVPYTINSSDAIGIGTANIVSISGGGDVTFTGTHAYAGATLISGGSTVTLDGWLDDILPSTTPIGNAGTLVFTNVADETLPAGVVTGSGTIEKLGAGILTLEQGPTGPFVITEGEVETLNGFSPSSFDIASGATLELNLDTFVNEGNATFTGSGTVLKTGAEQIRWAGPVLNFEMGSGALLDVQEGTFRGGSNANDVWTNNLADLNVAGGATFLGSEADIRVDALTGAGTIITGWTSDLYTEFALGVDNGSGTFTGVIQDTGAGAGRLANVTKEGTGTQVLDGINTYTGNTTVKGGVFELGFNGSLIFVPTGNGVTNQISGTAGTVNLDGELYIDLTNAAAGPGNSWTLVDPTNLTVNYLNHFVSSTLGDFSEDSPGIWTLADGVALWTFTESTGALTYNVGDEAKLWTGINGGVWDQATTANFSDNVPADPVANVTFDVATAITGAAGFADSYFSSGSSVGVTNSTITIAAGGVETADVSFFNGSVPYTIESSDTLGITGFTNISVAGSGSLTFQGTHSTTGTTTIAAGSTLTFDAASAPSSYASPIGGGGDIVKTGADVVDLSSTAAHSYTGTTTVTEGTLKISQNTGTTAVSIASGATFELDFNNRWGGVATYSGDGTFLKSGPNNLNFFNGTFELGSAAVIDVQEGRFTASSGGSGGSETWTNNQSSLNIAAGAEFTTVEGNVNLDTITGEGTLATGFSSSGYEQLTIGVASGSGTFDGNLIDQADLVMAVDPHYGHLHKVGTGTQTFGGNLTIRGNYDVQDGTVTLTDTGSITFYPAGNGVTNQVLASVGTGLPVLNLDGAINFDLSGADTTTGNMWTVLNPTNFSAVNIGSTATVTSSTMGSFTETVADTTFELDAGGFLWTFDVATATLSVEPGTAVGGYGTFQDTFFFPAEITAGDADADVDFDGGSLNNGIEFVVGGDPTDGSDDFALAPTLAKTAGGFIYTFRRTDDSAADNPGVEYGSDLIGFTLAEDGVDGVTVTVTDDGFDVGVDQVDVFLPDSLAVDGTLFARLTVTPSL